MDLNDFKTVEFKNDDDKWEQNDALIRPELLLKDHVKEWPAFVNAFEQL